MKTTNKNKIWSALQNSETTFYLIMNDDRYLRISSDIWGDCKEDLIARNHDIESIEYFNDPDMEELDEYIKDLEAQDLKVYVWRGYYEVLVIAAKRDMDDDEIDEIVSDCLENTEITVDCYEANGEEYDTSGWALFSSLEDAIAPAGYGIEDIVSAFDDENSFENYKRESFHAIVKEIVENQHGTVEFYDDYFEATYELYDGGSETFTFYGKTIDDFSKEAREAYEDWDSEEWTLLWIQDGKNNWPGIRQLLADGDEIEDFLENLMVATAQNKDRAFCSALAEVEAA